MLPAKKMRFGMDCGSKKTMSSMSETQKALMLDFISSHPHMIRTRAGGSNSSLDEREDWSALWDELAITLNNCDHGAKKDGCGWRRSWHDMKRYESLKAAEAMARASSKDTDHPQPLTLTPLQERIASLLSEVLKDESQEANDDSDEANSGPLPGKRKTTHLYQGLEKANPDDISDIVDPRSKLNVVTALESIAEALVERNVIEERKVKVFEKLLRVYATKTGVQLEDSDSDLG